MIRIAMSENQREKIETIYWNWMSRYHLEDFIKVIEADTQLRELIFKRDEAKDISLKKYLLSDCDKLTQIKSAIDKRGIKLQDKTADYLRARYKNYRNSQAAKAAAVLGIIACPYCNQNHVNAGYDRQGKFRFWGDLDHFYNKNTYPEMAICLYNLIPVCKVCNLIKSSRKTVFVNPYHCEKESNIKFRTEFDKTFDLDYLRGKSLNFDIIIDEDGLSDEDKKEIEFFDLKNRYSQLKRNAQEIIIKSKAYDKIYEKVLNDGFGLSDSELKAYVFGFTENHLDRILSKFNQDIMDEFIYYNETDDGC